jgi:hypothetical protein
MAQLRQLAEHHERWTTVVCGGLLRTFMQQPPPLFAAAPALGDNFYFTGMESPDDPRWKTARGAWMEGLMGLLLVTRSRAW